MFRETLEKGKALMDKITTVVMNYTPLEIKVREATNDEQWGPHGSLMNEIARDTNTYDGFGEIMNILWRRIFPENTLNWLRIYKSLVLLAFLLRNGSERVAEEARDRVYDLRTLLGYRCIDERGRDQGTSVRLKVAEVLELIEDSELLRREREKAAADRKIFYGVSSDDWCSSYNSNSVSGDRFSDSYRFSTRNATIIDESRRSERYCNDSSGCEKQPPRNILGDFDSWKMGRERSLVDNVAEKLSTALRAAKVVTNDFLGKPRVPPPSFDEDDPSVVSEDVFRFPNAIIDDDCVEYERLPNSASPNASSVSPRRQDKPHRTSDPKSGATLIDLVKHSSNMKKSTASIPRPPSTELISTSPILQHNVDPFDLFAEVSPKPPVIAAAESASLKLFSDFQATSTSADLLTQDTDFGDFASASFEKSASSPSNPLSWKAVTPLPTNVFSPTQTLIPASLVKSSSTFQTPQPTHTATPPSVVAAPAVGKTWQDLTSFNISLDLLVSNGSTKQQTASPSLRELKVQQQTNNFHSPLPERPVDSSLFPALPASAKSASIASTTLNAAELFFS